MDALTRPNGPPRNTLRNAVLFAFAGDWCDSRIFPGANPKHLFGIEQGTAWKRKGLIVASAIVAGALLP